MKASTVLFRGFIAKKRSQIKGRAEMFRDTYVTRETIHSGRRPAAMVRSALWTVVKHTRFREQIISVNKS